MPNLRRLAPLALVLAAACAGCPGTPPPAAPATTVASGNRNPVIQSLSANPTQSVRARQPITLQVSAYDSEPLQYTWSASGGLLSATAGQAIIWTPPAAPGIYSVLVVILNGRGGSVAASLNVEVLADGTAIAAPATVTESPPPALAVTAPPSAAATPPSGATTTPAPATTETPAPGTTPTPAPASTKAPTAGTTETPTPGATPSPAAMSPTPAATPTAAPSGLPSASPTPATSASPSGPAGCTVATRTFKLRFKSGKAVTSMAIYDAESGRELASADADAQGLATLALPIGCPVTVVLYDALPSAISRTYTVDPASTPGTPIELTY